MGSHHPARRLAPGVVLLTLVAAGCNRTARDAFPLSVGYQPLEPLSPLATWPAPTATDPHPEGLGVIVAVPERDHFASHARGYVHAPLDRVYAALHDPATSYIHNVPGGTRLDGAPTMDVEPFPVSFRVRYANSTVIGEVKFDVTYRAGPLEGTDAVPLVIGERYQKTWGTDHIQVMAGSLLATAVEGAPEVTSIEMIEWLRADTQGQSDCDGTLTDLFGNLQTKLASMP
ncbi:MAG TPA: hypothetical protein VLT47_01240 [Anaeromyxobacteraceae bacterium]|nr:hypothetical protein [Anaeromyxobacteraceae bacterium]